MVFENLSYDCETKTGSLRAGGYIRLGQSMSEVGRESQSVVGDLKDERSVVRLHGDDDPPLNTIPLCMPQADALARIFEHVRERLGEKPSVAFEVNGLLRHWRFERDLRMRYALQENGLLHELLRDLAAHHRRGHPREG